MATSQLYKDIIAKPEHWFETSLSLGEDGRLLDDYGDYITFGGDRILVDSGGAESGFRENMLVSVKTSHSMFADGEPGIGAAVAGSIEVQMLKPMGDIPKRARMALYVRASDGERTSDWQQQGTYYIDTRKNTTSTDDVELLTLQGFDAMLLSDMDFPSIKLEGNAKTISDKEMVQIIADNMKPDRNSKTGISVDERTWALMTKNFKFGIPIGYSMREVLRMIAACYGGNFVISPAGELRLIKFNDLPIDTSKLIDELGNYITFGGFQILI